jgi:hypothetical protein
MVWRYEKIISLHKNMLKTLFAALTSLIIVYLLIENIFQTTPLWALFPAGAAFYIIYILIFLKTGGLEEYDKEILITAGRKLGQESLTEKLLKILT